MIKLKDILFEIGNSTTPRPWIKTGVTKLESDSPRYIEDIITFRTLKKTVYNVGMEYIKLDNGNYCLEVSFKVSGGNYRERTNKFEIFSVMATVSDIISYAIKKNRKLIGFVKFIPTKTEHESEHDPADGTQRGKLYLAFVNNKLKSMGIKYKIETDGDTIRLYLL